MPTNVNDIIESLPASRQKKIETRGMDLIAEEMTRQVLRRARTMTQVEMAKNLGVKQNQISGFEIRTDMHIATSGGR